MKGVVFTEFLELVESRFGIATADTVMTKGCPFHRGFTSVGTYDYRELLAMIGQLSSDTGKPIPDLVQTFGKHLFQTFLRSYPDAFVDVTDTKQLLHNVESVIHVEVRKLYPDAELPSFCFPEASDDTFEIEYRSKRPFATLAHGLIEASVEHFGERLEVQRQDLDGEPETHALFRLIPRDGFPTHPETSRPR